MNQLTVPVLTMPSRDLIKADVLTPEIQELDVLKFEGIHLDAQIEPLDFEGIVNSTTPNLNPMGYIQNWIHPQAALLGGIEA